MNQKQLKLGVCFYLLSWFCSGVAQALIPQPASPASSSSLVSQIPLYNSSWLQLRNIQVAPDGLVLLVNGNPQVSIQRVFNPDRLVVDLLSTNVPPELRGMIIPVNRYGIKQVRVGQFQQEPAIARIVLDLDPNDPNSRLNWQTNFFPNRGGLLLTTTRGGTLIPSNTVPLSTTTNPPPSNVVNNNAAPTIQAITLNNSGRLVIQSNQPLNYRGSEDIPSSTYNISVSPAQISPQIQRPTLPSNSPIERVRLTQVGNSVFIGIKTVPGWIVRETDHTAPQEIALQVFKAGAIGQVPPVNNPASIANRGRGVVVIDPGHGGPDVGAIGNGIYEKNVTLPISLALGRNLQQMGYVPVYTRSNDVDLDLEPRVQIAQQVRADLFISVHANSLESRRSEINGVETYFTSGSVNGEQLARFVHNQIISATGALDRGVKGARFYVTRNTTMPAILIETGFITNPQEAANLNSRDYQERMAAAIARGIDQFLRSYGR